MKNEFTPELIEKAKSAKSAAELIALAKENGIELTNEEAAKFFSILQPQGGEMPDEDLESVAGGKLPPIEKRIVTRQNYCCDWKCKHCKSKEAGHEEFTCNDGYDLNQLRGSAGHCPTCVLSTVLGPVWICNNPLNYP